MNQIPLSALVGSQPLGALAAFGLLRVCSASNLGQVTLGWNFNPEPTAVLVTEKECAADTLLDLLMKHMQGRDQFPTFSGYAPQASSTTPGGQPWDDLKPLPTAFACLLALTCKATSARDREQSDFLSAFGSEMIAARSTGNLKPTAFDMTAGQQKFLKSVRELAGSLDPVGGPGGRQAAAWPAKVRAAFKEALFGPWTYADDYHSLGWDPSTEALYALSSIAPTDAGPKSVRAAIWLGVEALPLFPCFPVRGRLHTRGYNWRGDEFRWPVWREPISVDVLRSLLGLAYVYETPLLAELRCHGIESVYLSERPTDANGRGVFRPAILVPWKPRPVA